MVLFDIKVSACCIWFVPEYTCLFRKRKWVAPDPTQLITGIPLYDTRRGSHNNEIRYINDPKRYDTSNVGWYYAGTPHLPRETCHHTYSNNVSRFIYNQKSHRCSESNVKVDIVLALCKHTASHDKLLSCLWLKAWPVIIGNRYCCCCCCHQNNEAQWKTPSLGKVQGMHVPGNRLRALPSVCLYMDHAACGFLSSITSSASGHTKHPVLLRDLELARPGKRKRRQGFVPQDHPPGVPQTVTGIWIYSRELEIPRKALPGPERGLQSHHVESSDGRGFAGDSFPLVSGYVPELSTPDTASRRSPLFHPIHVRRRLPGYGHTVSQNFGRFPVIRYFTVYVPARIWRRRSTRNRSPDPVRIRSWGAIGHKPGSVCLQTTGGFPTLYDLPSGDIRPELSATVLHRHAGLRTALCHLLLLSVWKSQPGENRPQERVWSLPGDPGEQFLAFLGWSCDYNSGLP